MRSAILPMLLATGCAVEPATEVPFVLKVQPGSPLGQGDALRVAVIGPDEYGGRAIYADARLEGVAQVVLRPRAEPLWSEGDFVSVELLGPQTSDPFESYRSQALQGTRLEVIAYEGLAAATSTGQVTARSFGIGGYPTLVYIPPSRRRALGHYAVETLLYIQDDHDSSYLLCDERYVFGGDLSPDCKASREMTNATIAVYADPTLRQRLECRGRSQINLEPTTETRVWLDEGLDREQLCGSSGFACETIDLDSVDPSIRFAQCRRSGELEALMNLTSEIVCRDCVCGQHVIIDAYVRTGTTTPDWWSCDFACTSDALIYEPCF